METRYVLCSDFSRLIWKCNRILGLCDSRAVPHIAQTIGAHQHSHEWISVTFSTQQMMGIGRPGKFETDATSAFTVLSCNSPGHLLAWGDCNLDPIHHIAIFEDTATTKDEGTETLYNNSLPIRMHTMFLQSTPSWPGSLLKWCSMLSTCIVGRSQQSTSKNRYIPPSQLDDLPRRSNPARIFKLYLINAFALQTTIP